MDFGSLSRLPHPVGAANATPAPGAAMAGAVATDLPAAKAVEPAEAGQPVRLDIRHQPATSAGETGSPALQAAEEPPLERRHVIEPKTRTVVLERADPDTGETVSQVPDEALLKLRILMRELIERNRDDGAIGPRTLRNA